MCRVPDIRTKLFVPIEELQFWIWSFLAVNRQLRGRVSHMNYGMFGMKRRKNVWSAEEMEQLTEFVAAGGTPLRASVKFKRTMASCRSQARKLGVPFEKATVRRKAILAKCAAAERELSR